MNTAKHLLLSTILRLIRWYIGTGVFDRLKDLVLQMMDDDRTNAQKRKYVTQIMKKEYKMLRTATIEMTIAAVVKQVNPKTDKL